ncbi:hypothetical protein GCM10023347_17430 [Streptomyces chumphonensis]
MPVSGPVDVLGDVLDTVDLTRRYDDRNCTGSADGGRHDRAGGPLTRARADGADGVDGTAAPQGDDDV